MAEETKRQAQDLEDFGEDLNPVEPEDLPGIRNSLTRYRVMAWIVGTLLILLTLVAMPLKYIWQYDAMVTVVGVAHGWLYAVLLITVVDLGFRVKWRWLWYLGIALAGTVPFLSFYAEHKATKYVRQRIADVEAEAAASSDTTGTPTTDPGTPEK